MKAKKKHVWRKHQIRQEKRKETCIDTAAVIAVLTTIIMVSCFPINSMLNQSSESQPTSILEPKAAIVDHLSLTYPDQTFIQTATNTLDQAGYTVSYYPSEKVTVEFYKNLPSHAYSLLVLRVHSATDPRNQWVGLLSSELYSEANYVYEQLTNQVSPASFNYPPSKVESIYFGITPLFVTNSMKGQFPDTMIIMMGCNGLEYSSMAKAFIQKGAKVYISWDKSVSSYHTDQATAQLLQDLLTGKQTIEEAVRQTMKDVGEDPIYKSQLVYYPVEAGNYSLQDKVADVIISSEETCRKTLYERKKLTLLK